MAKYVIDSNTLTNIADAIREKTGRTTTLFPGNMPAQIRSIQTSSGESDSAGIPSDIVEEAERVSSGMIFKMGGNAITFIAMSDMHELGDGDLAGNENQAVYQERYRRANKNAGQGARLIADKINLDFFCNLGDLAWGDKNATVRKDTISSVIQAKGYTSGIHNNVESFFTTGNHDARYYGGYLDAELSECLTGRYRYVDFPRKKVRVICLNTADISDGVQESERVSGEQLRWFADSLDLSGKADAADWGIITLSHHPMDWGAVKPLANCLAAYLNGTTYSATHDGVSVSCNYAGKNAAAFIANFHGHTHCFKVANISGTEVKRIAIPNACFSRENEYGKEGNTEFGETESYKKSDDGTGKNTAFCLVSIDLDKKTIYADCFGAGYDRVIGYGAQEIVTYTVTNNLDHAINSNGSTTVTGGGTYTATITANDGYELDSVTCTMGGTSVTVTGGNISIANVTGDIVITATTKSNIVYNVRNLVLEAEETSSTDLYNGTGYKDGVYCSSSGGDSTDSTCVSTGYIPYEWNVSNVIYIRGAALTNTSHVRIYGYTEKGGLPANSTSASGPTLSTYFTVEELEAGTYYKLTPTGNKITTWIRFSLIGTGENLIVTVNEPIE